jgi:lantibiotic modifying enzyme
MAPRRSPLAWCYGDPGVAAALCVAGWHEYATDIAECAAARSIADNSIGDASICHGSAGLAHIFNRLHQATGTPSLRVAAEDWLSHLMDAQLADLDSGFLTGAAGVGLVLLAAATPLEPRWDRVLLLS